MTMVAKKVKTEFGQEMTIGITNEGTPDMLVAILMGGETRFLDLEHLNVLVKDLQNCRARLVGTKGNRIIDKFIDKEQKGKNLNP
jgi:hypothetical protein